MADDKLMEYLEYSVMLTLFGIAVIGLLGLAGVDAAGELLLRALALNGMVG